MEKDRDLSLVDHNLPLCLIADCLLLFLGLTGGGLWVLIRRTQYELTGDPQLCWCALATEEEPQGTLILLGVAFHSVVAVLFEPKINSFLLVINYLN